MVLRFTSGDGSGRASGQSRGDIRVTAGSAAQIAGNQPPHGYHFGYAPKPAPSPDANRSTMIRFPIRSGVPREPRHPTRPPLRHLYPLVQARAGHDDLRQPGRCGHRRPHAGRRTGCRHHRRSTPRTSTTAARTEQLLGRLLPRPARTNHAGHQGRHAAPRHWQPRTAVGQRAPRLGRRQPAPPERRPHRPVLPASTRPHARRWPKPSTPSPSLVADGQDHRARCLQLRGLADRRSINQAAEAVPARRDRWSPNSSTTSSPAGLEEEYLDFARTTNLATMVVQPARRWTSRAGTPSPRSLQLAGSAIPRSPPPTPTDTGIQNSSPPSTS